MTNKITIVGPQKLGSNLAKGFLRSGIPAYDITVVGRENTNFSRVEKLGLNITTKLDEALHADTILFAVQPKHVASLAHDLKKARKKISDRNESLPKQNFISVISGLSPNKASEMLGLPHNNVVCITTDTNVAFGKGIIPYVCSKEGNHSKSIELLGRLGEVRKHTKFKEVLKGVTLFGATKALDVEALELIYFYSGSVSVSEFIKTLDEQLSKNMVSKTGFLGWSTGYETDLSIKPYLMNKAKAIEKHFGFEAHDAILLAVETFSNTVHSLANEESLSTTTFNDYVKDVATEGGCTEKGLSEIVTVNDLKSLGKLVLFFSKVHNRTKRFKLDIRNSFKNLVSNDGQDEAEHMVFKSFT